MENFVFETESAKQKCHVCNLEFENLDVHFLTSHSDIPSWYKSFKNYYKRKEEEKNAYESSLSEYEKIRLGNITERQRIFNELQLGKLKSDLSYKKLNVKDEIWKKLCKSVDKKDEFSEAEMVNFFKTISGPKSTPSQIENNLRNVAKMYYLKTEKDFFENFPNILKVIEDLKNACEPPKQGTKRTQGKNEDPPKQGTKRTQRKNEDLFVPLDNPNPTSSKQVWENFCRSAKAQLNHILNQISKSADTRMSFTEDSDEERGGESDGDEEVGKTLEFLRRMGKAKHEPCGERWSSSFGDSAWRMAVMAICLSPR